MATTLPNRKNRLFHGDVIDLTSEVGNTKINVRVDDNLELEKMLTKKQIAPTNKTNFKANIQTPASQPINQTVLLPIMKPETKSLTNQFLIPISSSKGHKFLLVDQTVLANNNPSTPHPVQLIPKKKDAIKPVNNKDSLTQLNFKNIRGKIVVEKSPVFQKKSPNIIIQEDVTLSTNEQHKEEIVQKSLPNAVQENILLLPSSSEVNILKAPLGATHNQSEKKETTKSTPINVSRASLDTGKRQISFLSNITSINNDKQAVKSKPFSSCVAVAPSRNQRGSNVTSYSNGTLGAEVESNAGVIELSDDDGDNLIKNKETRTEKLILFSEHNEKKQTQNKQSIAISGFSEKNVSLQPSKEKTHHTITPRKEKHVAKISDELFANSLRNRWIDVRKAFSNNDTAAVPFKELAEKKPLYYVTYAVLKPNESKETQPEIDNNDSITPEEVDHDYNKTQEEVVKSNETQQEMESNEAQYIDNSHGTDPLESPPLEPLGVVTPVDITRILNRSKKIDGRCGCVVLKKGTKGFLRYESREPSCLKYIREVISRDEKKIKEFRRTLLPRVHFVQCDSDPSKFLPETDDGSNDLTAVFNNIEEQLQTELSESSSIPSITEVREVISKVRNDITNIMERSRTSMGPQEKLSTPEVALKLIHTGFQLIRNWNKETQLEKKSATKTPPRTRNNVVKVVKKKGRKKNVAETTTRKKRTRKPTNLDDFVYKLRSTRKTQDQLKVPLKTSRKKRKAEDYGDDLLIVKKVDILKKKRG